MPWVIYKILSSLPDKTYSGEAVPLLEVDGWRGVARLYPDHGGLNLRRRTEVVFSNLQAATFRDPDSGSGAVLTPGSGMGKKSESGSGINSPDYMSESSKNNFLG
jgi:hypothetical protein